MDSAENRLGCSGVAIRLVIRGATVRMQTVSSFAASSTIHGFLLAWLVLAAAQQPLERPRNIYQQEIQPFEKHLVWYNLRDKLPDVKPAEAAGETQTSRARVRFHQSIVAGKKDDARPSQRIVMPAPAIELPKALPLPNVLAVSGARPVRHFVPPPQPRQPPPPAPALPDAPVVRLSAPSNQFAVTAPQPVRRFVPPAEPQKPRQAAPVLPEAPKLQALFNEMRIHIASPSLRPVRRFTPPTQSDPPAAPAAPRTIPEAPPVAIPATGAAVTLSGAVMGPRRTFVEPPARFEERAPISDLTEPPSPDLASAVVPPAMPRIPRGFTAPPAQPLAESAHSDPPPPPAVSSAPGAAPPLAIIGLNPAASMTVPPPGSHEAGFSAGPKANAAATGEPANKDARVTIPGLATRGGDADEHPSLLSVFAAPTSRQNLLASLHTRLPAAPDPAITEPDAARLSNPPDARLKGRYVYTVAIQMPNITSYSGSWTVWFADHDAVRGAAPENLRPPTARRKVDPKYVQSAMDERVEGTVRLAAVIRRTGQVEAVELLQHLDERLDRSAQEALSKWEFEPAQLNGTAIDIDAVFEIPFRLAPKPKR